MCFCDSLSVYMGVDVSIAENMLNMQYDVELDTYVGWNRLDVLLFGVNVLLALTWPIQHAVYVVVWRPTDY